MGRKRIYLDTADKQQAYRERRRDCADMAAMAMRLYQHPTPDFVEAMARRLVEQSNQPNIAAVEALAATKRGIEKGLVAEPLVATAPPAQIDMATVWAGQQAQRKT